MKTMILNKSCENVVVIDWSKASDSLTYFQSANASQIVGRMIGCVINRLKADIGLNPQNINMYGHSLGAEAVGFAGKSVLNPKVRLIIGAEPAAPGFQGNPDTLKLAFTDAQFVLVMHTNGISNLSIPVIQGKIY